MTDQSPESRDPWAPPERPAVELGKQQGAPGTPGASGVHDQQTIAGMPGADIPQDAPRAGQPPAAAPAFGPAQTPDPAPGPPPAYGYPAQPASGGYGYPAQPDSGGYGYPAPPVAPQGAYPGQPGYPGYQGYPGYPPYAHKSNGFGVTALVLGIIAVISCYGGILFGIPAVIFGVLGRGKARRGEADNDGMALAGIITGIVGIVISCLFIAIAVIGIMFGDSGYDSDSDYSTNYSNTKVVYRG
ncbi:DUF4190 domain-containing protein [Streptomyces sp. NBC_00503]|uniref:DUF4190 domain-containing protein n=1 Tax=Streptomyces sp. NBC_00503 TaxID=2903659 RepID=UPI002E8183C0|nr:DUF4190 domain-containing protein [Streptomyces sp. NBC_00503]WUD83879.1 DUF4190 domain-containing protein [Streptomyces sp. NBC_00503]